MKIKIQLSILFQFLMLLVVNKPGYAQNDALRFDFGGGTVAEGFTQVTAETMYHAERGFGFLSEKPLQAINRGGSDALTSDFITSDRPFYFAVDVPEGNYQIILTLGDAESAAVITVKAESRRLMLKEVKTQPGKFETDTLTINVRRPEITGSDSIRRKPREYNFLNWDHQLTLEFNNSRPCINALEVRKVEDVVTVFLAGNSTVVDQEEEPWAAWGQMIPNFFKPGVATANYAESGETLKAFKGENRLKKLLIQMKPGDYLFIEFAHNDQKPGSSHVEPFEGYQALLEEFIQEARKRGGIPVLVTSMHRRKFDDNGKIINTLDDYPEAMRQTAKKMQVPLIDLTAMSQQFYEAMGPEKSVKAFVHYPAHTFPGQDTELKDDTHFNAYGAYELARCIVEGIRQIF